MRTIEEIIQTINPHLAILEDISTRERPAKRRAIEAVKKEALQVEDRDDACLFANALLTKLQDSLFICSDSAVEGVREQTVEILKSLVDRCEKGSIPKSATECLLQHLIKRLRLETTEEIRDAWMQLCATLLAKLTSLKISIKESELFMEAMSIAGDDPFAEIQKQCANLIILYAKEQPKSVDYACEKMIRLVIPLLLHKHTAVRVKGIKAMEAVLIASPKGLHLLFEHDEKFDKQPIIPALIYDNSALVRDNLFFVLGHLLCSWGPRDRYQYGKHFLPIILSGSLDDLPSIQTTCISSLSQVGKSCTQDLFDADIIKKIPADEQQAVNIGKITFALIEFTRCINISSCLGLRHLVHMCYDHCVLYLLHGITDFIRVKQETGLDSLKLFLQYVSTDDLVKSMKKLTHYLFIAYAIHTESTTEDKIYDILSLINAQLPSPEIFLDALLPRLESKSLAAEKNGYPGCITVNVVVAFLHHFIKTIIVTESIQKRIIITISKPYLIDYIDKEKLEKLKSSIIQNTV
ncbi:hypothetical protein [Parasitella parasitica]|uniref:Dynein axonemal assembly factor 5 TPR repeats domain-containing protein n=1 Tax=Parasitella parasitica TaxID=35722 RepID=A0A0B7MNS4_9FUNG|nr:hypothetical protein [Parasitella parasitica]